MVAVLHTGAYQDALASYHNLYGQLETWYVMEASAVDDSYSDGVEGELHCAHGGLEEWACRAAAAHAGLELPPGWSKARSTWVQATATVSGSRRFFAAVRGGESVAEVLRAVGMAVPDKRSGLGRRLTYSASWYPNSPETEQGEPYAHI